MMNTIFLIEHLYLTVFIISKRTDFLSLLAWNLFIIVSEFSEKEVLLKSTMECKNFT